MNKEEEWITGLNKQDRRIRKTKKAVHTALLELMKEKTPEEITIIELTEKADINRKTFYNHYSDVYAVLDEIEDDWINYFIEMFMIEMRSLEIRNIKDISEISKKIQEGACEYFSTMIRKLGDNLEFRLFLENCGSHSHILDKFVRREKEILQKFLLGLDYNETWLDYFLLFIASGTMTVANHWVLSDQNVPSEDLARFFASLFSAATVHDFLAEMSTPHPVDNA